LRESSIQVKPADTIEALTKPVNDQKPDLRQRSIGPFENGKLAGRPMKSMKPAAFWGLAWPNEILQNDRLTRLFQAYQNRHRIS
jgi:hypothetical protein